MIDGPRILIVHREGVGGSQLPIHPAYCYPGLPLYIWLLLGLSSINPCL